MLRSVTGLPLGRVVALCYLLIHQLLARVNAVLHFCMATLRDWIADSPGADGLVHSTRLGRLLWRGRDSADVTAGNCDDEWRGANGGDAVEELSSGGELRLPQQLLYDYADFVALNEFNDLAQPPAGLLNCGNSCFGAAALQCLTHTRSIAAYCLSGRHAADECTTAGWCFLCEFQRHVRRARGSQRAFSPIDIIRNVRRLGKHLAFGRQEDAHDFWLQMVNCMHNIHIKAAGGEKAFDEHTQETTLVHHVFGGYTRSQVQCMVCRHASNTFESTLDIILHITQANITSVTSALRSYTQPEYLDGSNKYKCDKCEQYVRARRALEIYVAPNVLVLTLRRYTTGRFGKLNKKVAYTKQLDLGPFMSQSCKDSTPATYELYAVLVHLDTMNITTSGHYVCYLRLTDDTWVKCDDGAVAPVSATQALNQNAYMLFYQRNMPRSTPRLAPADSAPAVGVPTAGPAPSAVPLAAAASNLAGKTSRVVTPQFTLACSGEHPNPQPDGTRWPARIIVTVTIPDVHTVTVVKTKVRTEAFTLRVKGKYSLKVDLPYPVSTADENASFDKQQYQWTVIMDVLPSAPAGWQRPSSQDSRAPLSSAAAANGKVVDVEIASTTSQLVNAQTESSRDGSSASYQVVDEASSALASSAGPGAKTELERPKAVRHTAPNGLDGGLLRENGASTSGYASKLPSEKSLLKQPEFRVEGNDLLVLLPELGTAPVTIDEDSLPHVIDIEVEGIYRLCLRTADLNLNISDGALLEKPKARVNRKANTVRLRFAADSLH